MSDRLALSVTSNLVLVGLRCSGKTSLGRQLAERLGRPFVDADEALEQALGCSLDALLAGPGEPALRRAEAALLDDLALLSGRVVATGGGAVLHAGPMARLAASGVVVYLDLPVDELLRRQRVAPRPRLRAGSLADEVATLHAERDGLYRSVADIVLIPEGPDSILARLEIWPAGPAAP